MGEPERLGNVPKPMRGAAVREFAAGRLELRSRYGLHEVHLVSELPESQQVLEHRPGGAAVSRIGGNHSGANDRQPGSCHDAASSAAAPRPTTAEPAAVAASGTRAV